MALARALINQPRVLLLDEPLGALDLKLREQMQVELKALQRRVNITFVYVTHDQGEALSMSDRLAVFDHGRIEQIGTPAEVYERPATGFVAGFVGLSNVCDAGLARRLTGSARPFTIRPEKIRLGDPGRAPEGAASGATGTIDAVQYLGAATRYTVSLDGGGQLLVLEQNVDDARPRGAPGQRVRLTWARRHEQPLQGAGGDSA